MPRNSDRIAMKPYLDSVTGICDTLSREELVELILELARDEPTSRRMAFLDRLTSSVPGKTVKIQPQEDLPALFEQVEALEEALIERRDAIEEGEYDLLDDWDYAENGWDDNPDYISEEQVEDLADLFNTAGAFFTTGNISDSRSLYGALFDLLDTCDEDCGYALTEYLDIKEERARYARSVYETVEPEERLAAFAGAMDFHASSRFDKSQPRQGFPMLRDVMETRQEELPGFDAFSKEWNRLLGEMGTDGRPASLTAEIVFMLEGFEGLGKLARAWGNSQPLGYLLWLEFLEMEDTPGETWAVATEALEILEPGNAREKVSRYLVKAGECAGNPDHVLEGKLQALYSRPDEANLLRVLDEAVSQGKRDDILATIMSGLAAHDDMTGEAKPLLLKTQLMAGRLNEAWTLVKTSEDQIVGWSYGLNPSLFFGAVASVMVNHDQGAGATRTLLEHYAGNRRAQYGYYDDSDTDVTIRFSDEIIAGLKRSAIREEAMDEYLDWMFLTGRDRVDAIVSNKHRNAYQRAAWVLVSLAEIHAADGRPIEADTLLEEYCRIKYNRFSAFKKEVKAVLASSPLLGSLGIGF